MQPATTAEIKAACPGCTDAFIVQCLEASMTISDAQTAHCRQQADENAQLRTENERLRRNNAELGKAKSQQQPKRRGVEALRDEGPESTAGIEGVDGGEYSGSDYWAAVRQVRSEDPTLDRGAAMKAVNKRYPHLREALVSTANSRR